ncbi:histidine phosphatase family protein [Atopomonas sediminilitoris]|uniref:histidine phosphatase family protein n=1 Tax=Atopomonas sediminilitoris TaxID=2919919 RepID=UPI001F4E840B|nr:histidine phosphatase family protein [Atopomonas sediminilitoris]MCJ8170182.1 histidine phosphatase family protein [Atopomonas sediminilitoris]
MALYALRHGATPTQGFRGRLDDELTPEGWTQMHAGFQQGPRWQQIVSSPLKRCRQFAEQMARELNLPLAIDPDWRELDFGHWEGRTASELLADPLEADALSRFWQDPYQHPPRGGEALLHFEQRIVRAWQPLAVSSANQDTLLISHGGVIRQLLRLGQNRPRSELMNGDVGHGSLHLIAPFPGDHPCAKP